MSTRRDRNTEVPTEAISAKEPNTVLEGVAKVMNAKLNALIKKIEQGFQNFPDRLARVFLAALQPMDEAIWETRTQAAIGEATTPNTAPNPSN